ncbi:MAG: hypothetical protein KIT58_15845 [Planctomycetota bacterium]|nr:hypothetical protein [Planctomycetota bacterium]
MAGGPHARIVPCMECAGPAERTHEGVESDRYRCRACGEEQGIDWRRGPAEAPTWPIPRDEAEAIRRWAAERRAQG